MEILFKGKNYKTDEWIEGNLIALDEANCFIAPKYPYASTMSNRDIVMNSMTYVLPDSICRYTGLTYQDGTKAWEGDVILHESGLYGDGAKGIIRYGKFNGKYIGFYIEWESKYHDLNNSPLYWIDKGKCIGNVIDNPKLPEVE